VQPNGDLCKYEAGSRNWTRQYSPNLPDNTSSSLKQKYKHCEVYVQNAETQKLQSFTEYNRNGIQQERNTTGTEYNRNGIQQEQNTTGTEYNRNGIQQERNTTGTEYNRNGIQQEPTASDINPFSFSS